MRMLVLKGDKNAFIMGINKQPKFPQSQDRALLCSPGWSGTTRLASTYSGPPASAS